MKHQALIFIGLVGAGVVLGATLVGKDTDTDSENNSQVSSKSTSISNLNRDRSFSEPGDSNLQNINQTLNQLQDRLQQEIEQRKILENKIALLEKRVNTKSSQDDKTSADDPDSTNTGVSANPHQPGLPERNFGGNDQWFNEQAMLDAGVDPTKVNFIKESFEQAEMDKLYLRDQAKREGWINSKRYTDAAREIADRTKGLRDQLNETEYDAYLYAAGRSNRVIVSSLLSTSPASNAGIQPGDTILKYDNKRVYNWSDLTNATSEGSPNDTVVVTIERNGQLQQVYLPRGPLGIRLTTDSVAP